MRNPTMMDLLALAARVRERDPEIAAQAALLAIDDAAGSLVRAETPLIEDLAGEEGREAEADQDAVALPMLDAMEGGDPDGPPPNMGESAKPTAETIERLAADLRAAGEPEAAADVEAAGTLLRDRAVTAAAVAERIRERFHRIAGESK